MSPGNAVLQLLLLLLLLLLFSSSSSSPLRRVFILTFLRQTVSLGNAVLQLFCCYYYFIIIIIIIIIIISFMQDIYTYIPEANCVPRE